MPKRKQPSPSTCVQQSIASALTALHVPKEASETQNSPPSKKQKSPKQTTRSSSRIEAKKQANQARLTAPERAKRAENYLRLKALKDPQDLKIFMSKPENMGAKAKRQLKMDAKRIEGGGCIREPGRPTFFGGKEGIEFVQKKIRKLSVSNQDRSSEVVKGILQEARAHVVAQNNGVEPFKQPSPRTIRRFRTKVLKHGSAHAKTSARAIAEKSLRNFVSYASLLGAVHEMAARPGGVHKALLMSQDFTRLVFGEGEKKVQWHPCDWEDIEGVPVGVTRVERRVVAVNLQAVLSAEGGAAPFLMYVKAPSMAPGEQEIFKLEGVGSTRNPDEFSYLVIDNRRKPSPELYHWYETEVLLPYLARVRKARRLFDDRAVLIKDGEYEQIRMYITQPEHIDQLEEAKLDVIKTFASGSAVSPPCDRGKCFVSAHWAAKWMPQSMPVDDNLRDHLTTILTPFFPGEGGLRNSTVDAIVRTAALLPFAFSAKTVSESFSKFGYDSFDVEKQISSSVACRDLTSDQLEHLLKVIQDGIEVAKSKGEFTEGWFAAKSLPLDGDRKERKEKDARAPHRRRSLLLTHRAFQARFAEQQQHKAEEQEKKEKARTKPTKAELKRQQEAEAAAMRQEALDNGPMECIDDDGFCEVCAVSFYAYQDYGLKQVLGANGKGQYVWKQCQHCDGWFCPVHTKTLTGKDGHESSCPSKKSKRKART